MRSRYAVAGLILVSSVAQGADIPLDLRIRYPHYHSSIVLDEQGRAVESREWSRTVVNESGVAQAKSASISFSTSAQTGEVIEAYNLKPDGRRIDVSKDNYQLSINRGKGKDSPLYSDRTTLTVLFPDVEVGDTEVFSYRITETEPLFPGKYSITERFGPEQAYDDVRVRIDYPESLDVQYGSYGMEQQTAAAEPGRKVVEWRYSNPEPVRSERQDWSIVDIDKETHYSFSTFASYAEIASAYGVRAKEKAAVTDRIRQLAEEIAGKASTPREQAQALYEWVAKTIGYAGNCVGIGAVVPRDLTFVLDNRIGDCKDHATLLQALLAARGIDSTQALINAGSIYALPKIPVLSTVNHVINYIPSLDLYLDSTSSSTPFGRLPDGEQGKPVLLVDGFSDDARTPVRSVDADSDVTKTAVAIDERGAVTGNTEVFLSGDNAASARAWARRVSRDQEEVMVREIFRGQNMIGSGTFSKDDPTALADTYHYRMDYTVEKYMKVPGAGAFFVNPPAGSAAVPQALQFTSEAESDADVLCSSGLARDEYRIQLPKALKILAIPEDLNLENRFVSYKAQYSLEGRELTVVRTLTNRMPGNSCSPELVREYKTIGDAVFDDLRSQVLYKLGKIRTGSDG